MAECFRQATPLLASPQGGVAERSRKYREAPLIARPGWFSDGCKRKTTPAASALVAARHFLDDAATPPCGDARRGITRDSTVFQFIHTFFSRHPTVDVSSSASSRRS